MKPFAPSHRVLIAGMLIGMLTACNASTAHLADIKLGTDKDVTTPTTHLQAHDDVYAIVAGQNLPNKVTITVNLIAEKVQDTSPNTTIGWATKSFDLEEDGGMRYHLSAPPNGWPAGTYKITATMMDEGTKRDTKSIEYTVTK